ncbi:MAG: ABC transporter ATP-binding protein [Gammaproteobacteria bacterium]|nr:ABC transporter ATP-binding protein [Gammaproteobacteria bacterium]
MTEESYDPKELFRIKTIRELAAVIPRALKLAWDVSPLLIVFVGGITLVTAFIPAATIYLTKVIVDAVFESQSLGLQWGLVVVPLAVIFSLWLGSGLIQGVMGVAQQHLSQLTYNSTSEKLLRKASQLDLAFFEAPKFYDQLKQAEMQQGVIQHFPIQIFGYLQTVISLSAMMGLISLLHPLAFVVLVVTVLPRFFLQGYMTRRSFQLGSEFTRNWRQTSYMESLLFEQEKAKEVRIFGLGDLFIGRYMSFRSKFIAANKKQMLEFMGYNFSLDALSALGIGAVSVYAVMEAARGEISPGTLTAVLSAAQQVVGLVGGLVGGLNTVYRASLEVSRLFELLDIDPQSITGALEPPRRNPVLLESNRIEYGIRVENVSFRYPGTDKEVLRGVTFSVPVGSNVAIVGENGAGKTTLVKLLARLYDPVGGSILLDRLDYRDYDLECLRSSIGIVFQDFIRYDLTAAQNIGVGSVSKIEDRERITEAAIQSGADAVVEGLPQRYDTVLGRTMDEGVDLSGGEWQQLSVARAYMSESPILILDEPTAALDSLRERALYEKISELSDRRTVIFISHRFSTVRMADIIVVIEDGKSVEVGSHEDLIARKGSYFKMFETQAEKYR